MKITKVVRLEDIFYLEKKEIRDKMFSKLIGVAIADTLLEHGFCTSLKIERKRRCMSDGLEEGGYEQLKGYFTKGVFTTADGVTKIIDDLNEILEESWLEYWIEFSYEENNDSTYTNGILFDNAGNPIFPRGEEE